MIYNTAIIGLGNIAWKMDNDPLRKGVWTHAKAYYLHKDTKIVAVYDPYWNKEEMRNFSEIYKKIPILIYANMNYLFQDKEIDIVSVCSPTDTHLQIIKELVKYPIKAIFCEKPVSYSSSDCQKIIKMCEDKGIVLAVNYMRRWESSYQEIKNIIDSKELGDLKSIVAFTNTALYMNASHMIDLINWFSGGGWVTDGRVSTDYVREVNGFKDYGGKFYFSNKEIDGFLYAYCDDKNKNQFELNLQFTNGKIVCENDGRDITISEYKDSSNISNYKEMEYKRTINSGNERMLDAIQNIIDTIEGKDIIKCSGKDALEVHRFIKEIYKMEGMIC